MTNGAHEGHSGHYIRQVYDNMDASVGKKPNLVLINAGTNDCNDNIDINGAVGRLADVVDKVFRESQRATVVLSTLLINKGNSDANGRVNFVNEGIRRLVYERRQQGQRIVLADMNDGKFITAGDLGDALHPTNDGYRKMAAVWDAAIGKAVQEAMVQDPEDTGIPDDQPGKDCPKVAGNGKGPVKMQVGSGQDDGPYRHKSTSMGVIWSEKASGKGGLSTGFSFAQLVNALGNSEPDGVLDDIVVFVDKLNSETGHAQATMFTNLANGKFDSGRKISIPDMGPCANDYGVLGVRWGDVNGDLLDDFICIGDEGNMYVALNRGATNGYPKFEYIGMYYQAPAGYEQRHVRLGDIDGDGRLDYCLTHERDGNIRCWRNGGQGDRAEYWQDYGIVFTAKGMGDIAGTRLIDINGDFRSDWVWVYDDGKTRIFTNLRGQFQGSSPYWLEAINAHAGMGEAGARFRVKFGRIYGGGKRDYGYITSKALGGTDYQHELHVWRNEAEGGLRLKADGNRYCDMTGDGLDDYLWVRSTGEITMYRNIDSPPNWGQDGVIFDVQRDRKSVHFADWTGDGKCDILAVDKTTGAVDMWENTYSGDKVTFKSPVRLAGLRCTEGWGVGVFDLGLRFADITGDGKADYLCMEKNGRTYGYVNEWPKAPRDVGQIKYSVGKDRANHRWADVNGDGKADFLWVDKFDGSTEVYYNEGEKDPSERPNLGGSLFKWAPQGKLYNGISRGANEYFPDMDGNGRADIYVVDPVVNTAEVWYNSCPEGGSGGDDQNMDPNLPTYSQPADPVPPRDEYSWGIEVPSANVWVALGDSYSAGIGAGNELRNPRDPSNKCHTTDKAYPKAMEANVNSLRQGLDFISCSGDTARDMLYGGGRRGGKSQLSLMQENAADQYKVLTLSIGGNDVGFFDVVKSCVLAPAIYDTFGPGCEEVLNRAEEKVGLHDGSANSYINFKADLRKLYSDILAKSNPGTTLLVLGYAQFFNANTEKCNDKSMALAKFPSQGKLTRDFRARVNRGVLALNTLIREQVNAVQNELGDGLGSEKRVRYLSIDHLFNGHRFCETEAGVDLPTSWFFLPFSKDQEPDGDEIVRRDGEYSEKVDLSRRDDTFCNDPTTGWDCLVGHVVDEGGELNNELYPSDALKNPTLVPRAAVSKAFHPRAIGHDAISKLLPDAWEYWTLNPSVRSFPFPLA